jgi:hypothetical protein
MRRVAAAVAFTISDLWWELGLRFDPARASLCGLVNRDIDKVLRKSRPLGGT